MYRVYTPHIDRISKLVVLGWTATALAAVVYFSSDAWPALPWLAGGAAAGMWVASARARNAVAAVLVLTYVFPVVIRLTTGLNYAPFSSVWTAALLGAIAPDALRSGWRLPARWVPAIACWALIVVAGTSIVVAREFDFTWRLVHSTAVANSSAGGWPSFVATWSMHVAIVLLSGMLWFDWLFGLDADRFRRGVAIPLAISCATMVAAALYQLFIDVTFLNPTVYGAMGRASGTLMDANLCGTVAGVWSGGFVLLLGRSSRRRCVALMLLGIVGCWIAVWASGSRTGLLAACVVLPFIATYAIKRFGLVVAVAGVVAVVAAAAALLATAPARIVGPLQRSHWLIPEFSTRARDRIIDELWHRNGYGTIGNFIVREEAWAGVGVGAYYYMQADYAKVAGLPILPPDNAQNWYRHQLAELGVVGSVAWVAWLGLFAVFLARPPGNVALEFGVARSMIVAFGLLSFVGMPGQEVPAAITFWTMAFWAVSLSGLPAGGRPPARVTWTAGVIVVAAFSMTCGWTALTHLRVPVRAQRVGWPYAYGFHERLPGDPQGSWTGRHAVAVVEAPTRHLILTVTPNELARLPAHQHDGRSPLRLDVRVNGAPVHSGTVASNAPNTRYVALPEGERWVLIEGRVSETFTPASVQGNDRRDLGVLLRWEFVDRAPAGS